MVLLTRCWEYLFLSIQFSMHYYRDSAASYSGWFWAMVLCRTWCRGSAEHRGDYGYRVMVARLSWLPSHGGKLCDHGYRVMVASSADHGYIPIYGGEAADHGFEHRCVYAGGCSRHTLNVLETHPTWSCQGIKPGHLPNREHNQNYYSNTYSGHDTVCWRGFFFNSNNIIIIPSSGIKL